jgi:hypothetical protein
MGRGTPFLVNTMLMRQPVIRFAMFHFCILATTRPPAIPSSLRAIAHSPTSGTSTLTFFFSLPGVPLLPSAYPGVPGFVGDVLVLVVGEGAVAGEAVSIHCLRLSDIMWCQVGHEMDGR